ncbi:hypothetical protein C8T65DRAFT_701070 [Cerioporus squamosus]|nr:hypothetical protein C8T65DRAFT_701070 [Cerioporus squamosus]
MSHCPSSNNPTVPIADAWTANSARILAFATPTPTPQPVGDVTTTPQNAADDADLSSTLSAIKDTPDRQAMAPYLRTTRNYDNSVTPLDEQHQQGQNDTAEAMALVAQQLAAAPLSNQAQRLSAFQQLHIPLHVLAQQDARPERWCGNGHNEEIGGTWVEQDEEVDVGPMLLPAAALAATLPATPPGLATPGWGSTPTHTDTPGSSPLSFDWDSPTPTGRRTKTGEAIQAGRGYSDPENASTSTVLGGNANALSIATASATETIHVTATNSQTALNTGANLSASGALDLRDYGEAYHGERLCVPLTLDNPPSLRKRAWAGSPNPEDMQRSLQRPRRQEPTNARAPAVVLPSEASNASNPWRSASREAGPGWDRLSRGNGDVFAPVLFSTPTPSTVSSRNNRTLLGQQSALLVARCFPNCTDTHSRTHPDQRTWSEAPNYACHEPTRPTHAPLPMEVDPTPITRVTSSPDVPKRDKGKKKATFLESDDSQAGNDGPGPEEGGWDERELLEACWRSARPLLSDRPRRGPGAIADTPEAGPSRRAEDGVYGEYGASYASQRSMRDERSSHLPPTNWYANRQGNGGLAVSEQQSHGHSHYSREPSGFHPLPNTRAAEFMAQADPTRRIHTPPLTQRPRLAVSEPRHVHEPRPLALGTYYDSRTSLPPRDHDEGDWMRSVDGQTRQSTGIEDPRDDESDYDEDAWQEDGEILPTVLLSDDRPENDLPTEPPRGGFPRIHRDDPETPIRGMAAEWIRVMWADPANTDVFIEVYNYRYSEDDEHNCRVSDLLQWAFEQFSGERGFDVVPPEPAENTSKRSRDRPTIWAIRGLLPRSVARAVSRYVWSFKAITFFAFPRAVTLPSWILMLEGYLTDNVEKIRAAFLRVLREEGMWEWIADMTSRNPDFAGLSAEDAVEEVLGSIRVDTFQLTNGNHIANVHVGRSPTRSMREWRQWVAALRARRYPSFTNGTGRVRCVGGMALHPGKASLARGAGTTRKTIQVSPMDDGHLNGSERETTDIATARGETGTTTASKAPGEEGLD